MKPGKSNLPISSSKPKAQIIRVELLLEGNVPYDPPRFEFWVVILGEKPRVEHRADTFADALYELERLGYTFQP